MLASEPSCAFGPTQDLETAMSYNQPVTLGTFIDAYLFPGLDAAGLDTQVWLGTFANPAFVDDYWSDMMTQRSADRIVGAGLQWDTRAFVQEVFAGGYLVMQSEHQGGNYPFVYDQATSPEDADRDSFLAEMAPNNHAYGEESWDLLKSWIDEGVHAYNAWNLVLDNYGWALNEVRLWPQNAMLTVDANDGTLRVTPYYYVMRHVAQYVEVGATRVGIEGDALAFQNPDNSVVAILRTTEAGTGTLSIDGTLLRYEASGSGWVTVVWAAQ
jgi:glucosylceramidase